MDLRSPKTPRDSTSKDDGHFRFTVGENLTPRYKILRKLGEGTFGQVLECWDRLDRQFCAVKIIRSTKKYRDAAIFEIDVLQDLKTHALPCVQILNWFDYCNHICIVCEMLGPSLFDFLSNNNYQPLPLNLFREVAKQLLQCVAFIHDLGFIHTDLKPENILFVSSEYVHVPNSHRRLPKSSAIKLIDFGSTVKANKIRNSIVSTRQYRAPEVILGVGWSYPCDLWSIGCILAELCSGKVLFATHENLEHLAMMERSLGPLPYHILREAEGHVGEKYASHGRLNWPDGASSRESIRAVRKVPQISNMVMRHVDYHCAGDLIDLLQSLLQYDPNMRITAEEALEHSFFTRYNRHYRN